VVFTVTNANPNGDPLNGNRPRETYDGLGEISDVCIKRKLRNRLQDMGEKIFVEMDERSDDGFGSLSERASSNAALKKAGKDKSKYTEAACKEWYDVRAFGQVFAFKAAKDGNGVSVGIRGPVSLQPALSRCPVEIESIQITKSVNSEPAEKKSSDTMGSKHRVPFGLYSFCGSINCQLAERTGFSEKDAEQLHEALRTLFDNDASSARPEGSMEVCRVYWWKHNCKTGQYSSAQVHRSLSIEPKVEQPHSFSDFTVCVKPLDGLAVQEDDLF
jgi:CRISPR-associated protein Csd2